MCMTTNIGAGREEEGGAGSECNRLAGEALQEEGFGRIHSGPGRGMPWKEQST
jgi:hypothetical protein